MLHKAGGGGGGGGGGGRGVSGTTAVELSCFKGHFLFTLTVLHHARMRQVNQNETG